MTQLVDDLKARLLENAEREFLKDISLNLPSSFSTIESST